MEALFMNTNVVISVDERLRFQSRRGLESFSGGSSAPPISEAHRTLAVQSTRNQELQRLHPALGLLNLLSTTSLLAQWPRLTLSELDFYFL